MKRQLARSPRLLMIDGSFSRPARTRAGCGVSAPVIANRNTRAAYARAVKQFLDWCEDRRLELHDIDALSRRRLRRATGQPDGQADRQAAFGGDPAALRLPDQRRNSGEWICR